MPKIHIERKPADSLATHGRAKHKANETQEIQTQKED